MTLPKFTLSIPELTINPVQVGPTTISEPFVTTSEKASGEGTLNLN